MICVYRLIYVVICRLPYVTDLLCVSAGYSISGDIQVLMTSYPCMADALMLTKGIIDLQNMHEQVIWLYAIIHVGQVEDYS